MTVEVFSTALLWDISLVLWASSACDLGFSWYAFLFLGSEVS